LAARVDDNGAKTDALVAVVGVIDGKLDVLLAGMRAGGSS
jgi:hypothetical protein